MKAHRSRLADATKILTRQEIARVLAELHRKAPRSKNTRLNLIIFRLACCCGLRASEIAMLQLADVRTEVPRPHLRIRTGASKGGRPRTVPLWWDAGTLADIAAWRAERDRAGTTAPFVASFQLGRETRNLSRHTLRKRFRTACRPLGVNRLANLTIHHGRHTFISHALAGGRSLAEVRDAAGHGNVTITSRYIHAGIDSDEQLGVLFPMRGTQFRPLWVHQPADYYTFGQATHSNRVRTHQTEYI
jgi:integrase